MTSTTLTPEICIIGGGAAGLSVAAAAAAFGVPVVLVEQGKMGGQSLNTGCVPSKALVATAHHFARLRSLHQFGVSVGESAIDWAKVRTHIQDVIAAIAPNDSEQRFRGLGVNVIKGTARFIDRDTLAVGDTTIKAARFVVATGSLPAIPLIHGLDTVPVLTSETVFDLPECPQHLLVIGGGATGVELAQAFQRFGVQVTIIEAMKVLGNEDPEGVDVLLAALERDGVTVHAEAATRNVSRAGSKIRVTFETRAGERTVEGTHVLITAGRRPNIDSLNLTAAGVKFDAAGIAVDKRLRTSNKKIFAVGDVTGGPHFAQVANHHASVFIKNVLLRMPAKTDLTIVPRATFTDPELAQVGFSEDEASKKGKAIRVLRWSYYDNARAQAERNTRGHIKVIADKRGKVLGATIVGENAGELIATWTLAVAQGLNIRAMAELAVPYPTLAEVGKRAAVTYFTSGLRSSPVQRLLTFLRLRG